MSTIQVGDKVKVVGDDHDEPSLLEVIETDSVDFPGAPYRVRFQDGAEGLFKLGEIELVEKAERVLQVGDRVRLLERRYPDSSDIRQPEVGVYGDIVESLDDDGDYRVHWDGDFTLHAHHNTIEWAGLRFSDVIQQDDTVTAEEAWSAVDAAAGRGPVLFADEFNFRQPYIIIDETHLWTGKPSYGEVLETANTRFKAASDRVDTSHGSLRDSLRGLLGRVLLEDNAEEILRELVGA